MIPAHTACLKNRDFLPYLQSILFPWMLPEIELDNLWESRLNRKLIPTPTGRHALWYFLELYKSRLKKGDEVIIAGYNFYVIVRILIQWGVVPVFVDIDPETLCIDPQNLSKHLTECTAMVLVTHMFGNPAQMTEIVAFCQQNNLLLFEDCAHSIGTLSEGKQVGQSGEGALFSFGIQKIVNSFGGGMLAVKNNGYNQGNIPMHKVSELENFSDTFLRALASYFMQPRLIGYFVHPILRLAKILAQKRKPQLLKILDPARDDSTYRFVVHERAPFKPFMLKMHQLQLQRLEENISKRREVIHQIKSKLSQIKEIQFLNEDKYGKANAAYFGIYVPSPDALADYLQKYGIYTKVREFYDCSTLPQFAEFAVSCPHCSYATRHLVRLPSYPNLTKEQITYISKTIENFFKT